MIWDRNSDFCSQSLFFFLFLPKFTHFFGQNILLFLASITPLSSSHPMLLFCVSHNSFSSLACFMSTLCSGDEENHILIFSPSAGVHCFSCVLFHPCPNCFPLCSSHGDSYSRSFCFSVDTTTLLRKSGQGMS